MTRIQVIIVVLFLHSPLAQANVGEAFGFGSRAGSLAGATVAGGAEGFGAYSNPAMAPSGSKRMQLSFGMLNMTPKFKPIENVVRANDFTADGVTVGSVDTNYRSTFGHNLGISYLISPSFFRLAMGLSLFAPVNQLAFIDSGDSFLPEYVLYRARTQRPQFDFGLSLEPVPGLRLGASVHIGFAVSTNAVILMQTDSSKTSTLRFSASVKPRLAPSIGLIWGGDSFISVGSVLRFPVNSPYYLTLNAGTRALGNLPILDFNLMALSSLFYDPLTLEVGTALAYLPHLKLYIQADYQAWSRFSTPSINIQKPTTGEGGVNFSPSQNPSFKFKDIWIPRIGHEVTFDFISFRVGYGFRPSILKDLPTGAGNYLDPPKHIYTAGIGFKFSHFLHFDAPCSIDLHGAYHALVTQHISKTPGDETGAGSGFTKIGSPSYDAGGKIQGGGLTVSLEI